MIVWSVSAFVFRRIRACSPSAAALATARISSTSRRAQVERRDEQLAERLRATEAGDVVEEVGDVGRDLLVGGEEPEVLVDPGGERVVVAGPDVDVAPQGIPLAPDDERRLRVDLEVREAVDDVDARALHRPRPFDVPVLVEAGLELDEAHALAPVLGHLDQRRDDRRVVARPVHGRLQCDRPPGPARPRWTKRSNVVTKESYGWWTSMSPRRISEKNPSPPRAAARRAGVLGTHGSSFRSAPVERGELREVGEVEQPADRVHLLLAGAEPLHQPSEHPVRDRARHLEPDDVAEAAAAQLQLDRLEQVVGLVGDLEVGVARDAEDGALDDLHLREEPVEEVRDHGLERDERAPLADLEEARQALGHLHAREALLPRLRIANEDGEAVGEARDVRERLPGPDGERRQHRVDLAVEAAARARRAPSRSTRRPGR